MGGASVDTYLRQTSVTLGTCITKRSVFESRGGQVAQVNVDFTLLGGSGSPTPQSLLIH